MLLVLKIAILVLRYILPVEHSCQITSAQRVTYHVLSELKVEFLWSEASWKVLIGRRNYEGGGEVAAKRPGGWTWWSLRFYYWSNKSLVLRPDVRGRHDVKTEGEVIEIDDGRMVQISEEWRSCAE